MPADIVSLFLALMRRDEVAISATDMINYPGYVTMSGLMEVSGPGPQRIVTGAGGEIYYTPDHYSTFIRLDH